MSLTALAFALAAGAAPTFDAEEAGRVAFVRLTEAPGRSALDPVLDGLRAADAVVLSEQPQCGAPDLDAVACLKRSDRSVGVVLQLGAELGEDAPVVATLDCAGGGLDGFERVVGGPFTDDASARAWGRDELGAAIRRRLEACDTLPARVTSDNALPAGTTVQLGGARLATLAAEAPLDVVGLAPGLRRFTFQNPRFNVEAWAVDAAAGETVTGHVPVARRIERPRWLLLTAAGASVAAGAALFGARHAQRSGLCLTGGATCDVDTARAAHLDGTIDLGAPATMLAAGGVGLAVGELAVPRKEPWWLIGIIGAATAGLSSLPWLF